MPPRSVDDDRRDERDHVRCSRSLSTLALAHAAIRGDARLGRMSGSKKQRASAVGVHRPDEARRHVNVRRIAPPAALVASAELEARRAVATAELVAAPIVRDPSTHQHGRVFQRGEWTRVDFHRVELFVDLHIVTLLTPARRLAAYQEQAVLAAQRLIGHDIERVDGCGRACRRVLDREIDSPVRPWRWLSAIGQEERKRSSNQ